MSKVKVTVDSNRARVQRQTAEGIQRGLESVGMTAVRLTQRDKAYGGTPVVTGRLKNSIAWATSKREGFSYAYTDDNGKPYSDQAGSGLPDGTVVIGTNVEYAELIEEGRQGRAGAHMLRNAISDVAGSGEAERIMKASIEAALD